MMRNCSKMMTLKEEPLRSDESEDKTFMYFMNLGSENITYGFCLSD